MTYGRVHRFLLRSIASRGVLTLIEAEKAVNSFSDEQEISVKDLVKSINEEIRPYKQTIKITNDEITNEEVIIFLSLGYDKASMSQNIFNANELEYFRLLIEEIMTSDSRQITGIHAMNLVGKMKVSFTKTDAQKHLNLWCNMKYLDKILNNYALGVRTIHEFDSYLKQNMPDSIEECFLCKQIVFHGYNCPSCGLAIHTRCLNHYIEKIKKWPCCKTDYNPSQLEQLNCKSSRLTQNVEATQQSEVYDMVETVTQEPATQESSADDVEMTQQIIPEISQRVTRKRKRPRLESQDSQKTRQSEVYGTVEESMTQETATEETPVDDVEMTQQDISEVSQRVNRKKKRQS